MKTTPSDCIQSFSLWLHHSHADAGSGVLPFDVPRSSPLEGFANRFAEDIVGSSEKLHSDDSQPMRGIPCRLCGMDLCIVDEQSLDFKLSLFFADVACITLLDMLLFVVVPPPLGASLQDSLGASDKPPVRGDVGWCLISDDVKARSNILDSLRQSGCIIGDFDQVHEPIDEVMCRESFGSGAYRRIDSPGTFVMVKKAKTKMELDQSKRELIMLNSVKPHRNLVDFRGIFRSLEADAFSVVLCFEHAPCGDVLYRIVKGQALKETAAKPIFDGIMHGLAHLHSKGVIHRDVKAENLLLKAPDFPVLSDFALATTTSDPVQMARRCGSPGYAAPEVCLGRLYGPKVDVFAAGVLLYFVLSKEMPFRCAEDDDTTVMRKTVKCRLDLRKPPFSSMTRDLRSLMRAIVCRDAGERLSSERVLAHPWLSEGPDQSTVVLRAPAEDHERDSTDALSADKERTRSGNSANRRRSSALEPIQENVNENSQRWDSEGKI